MPTPATIEITRHFQAFLEESGLSHISIKNYVSDVRQFLTWSNTTSARLITGKLVANYLEEIRTNKPEATYRRYLASIRRFVTFLKIEYRLELPTIEYPQNRPGLAAEPKSFSHLLERFRTYLTDQKKTPATIKNYISDLNHFLSSSANQTPPASPDSTPRHSNLAYLLTPNTIRSYFDHLKTSHTSTSVLNRRESTLKKFVQFCLDEKLIIHNPFEKNFPLPSITIEPPNYSTTNSIKAIQTNNPIKKIYYRYHALPFVKYLHLGILILATTALGIFGYDQIIGKAPKGQAYPSAPVRPARQLAFQGRLTDTSGTPITSGTAVIFKIWSQPTGGKELYQTSSCQVIPDQDGVFSAQIGNGSCGPEISQDVFSENNALFMEVSIGGQTLTPRQPVVTAGYALNSETLQGYPASESATPNTVPVVDSTGQIGLGGNSPAIVASSGNFALKGNAITLTTNTGTDGNITIAPDGRGKLNIIGGVDKGTFMKVTDANLTTGNLIEGYVGNNDPRGVLLHLASGTRLVNRLTVFTSGQTDIIATTFTKPAFSINQTGTGPIFSAKVNGKQTASLNYNGDLGLIGGISIGLPLTTHAWPGQFLANANSRGQAAMIINQNDSGDLFAASASGKNFFVIAGNGNVGINTTNPTEGKLVVSGRIYTDTLTMAKNPINGYILTSDAGGNASWQPGSISTTGWTLAAPIVYPNLTSYQVLIGATATASAIAKLTVYGDSLTQPAAYFNATTSANAMTVDNDGSGNIFAAQKSGSNKFIVAGNGNVTISGLANAGGVVWTDGSGVLNSVAGTGGLCLTSGGSSAPVWVSCSVASNNYWQRNSGTLEPGIITDDLLLGATSTGSAKIALINVATGTPTATLSATNNNSTYLNATGTLATTNAQTLTLGAAGTGNVVIAPGGTTALTGVGTNLTAAGNLTINGAAVTLAGASTIVDMTGTGTLSLNTVTNRAITTGTGLTTLGGNLTINGTAVSLAGATGSIDSTTGTLSINTVNNKAITTGTGLTTLGGNETINGTALTLAGASTIVDMTGTGTLSLNTVTNRAITTGTGLLTVGGNETINGTALTLAGASTVVDMTGTGTLSLNTVTNRAITTGTGVFTMAGDLAVNGSNLTTTTASFNLLNTNATTINFGGAATTLNIGPGGASATSVNIAGGSAATGCTVDGATGNFTCSGNITSNGTGTPTVGFWTRNTASGFLYPSTLADKVGINNNTPTEQLDVVGNATISGNLTFYGGARTIVSRLATSLTLGDTQTGNLIINNTNARTGFYTTSPLATVDVHSNLGTIPVASISGATSMASLVVDQTGVGDIFTASASGNPRVTISNTGNLTFNQASTIDTTTGNLVIGSAGTATTGNVYIGNSASSTTPDILVVGQKSTAGNPTAVTGGIYYNANANTFYIAESGTWKQLCNKTDQACGTGSSTVWSGLLNPTANLSLSMGTNTTNFNWATGTGSNDLFTYSTDNSANGTGSLVNIQTGTSATVLPLRVRAGNTEAIMVDSTGRVGIGTSSPSNLTKLDIRGISGTTSTASVSGTSSFATLVVDNNTGDIFTASSAGNPRFTIANNGNIALNQATVINATGTLSLNTTNNQAITTGTGLVTTGGDLQVNGANLTTNQATFNLINTTATTLNIGNAATTMNLGPGGVAAASLNLVGGSGATGCTADGATGNFTCSGNITSNGTGTPTVGYWTRNTTSGFIYPSTTTDNVVIGTTSNGDPLTVVRDLGVGASEHFLASFYRAVSGQPGMIIGYRADGASPTRGLFRTVNNFPLDFGTTNFPQAFSILDTNGNIGVNATTPVATLDVRRTVGTAPAASISGASSFANLVVDQTGVGDIFTASSSGLNRFVIQNNGNVGIGTVTPAYKLDVSGGAGIVGQFSGRVIGGQAVNNNEFITLSQLISGTGPWSRVAPNVYLTAVNDQVGIGTSTPVGKLQVINNVGTTSAASISATSSFAALVVDNNTGDIFTASSAGNPRFVIQNNGNVGIGTVSPAYKLDVQGGSGIVGQFSGRVIGGQAVNGNEFITLAQEQGGAGSFWQRNSGTLEPTNLTDDLLLGAISTASAKFAFINVATGTPTASIAGSTIGVATSLTGNGTLATTNMQPLTLGGASTGPIQLSPKGTTGLFVDGAGNVGIGTTVPNGTLSVVSTNATGTGNSSSINLTASSLTSGTALNIAPPDPKVNNNTGILTSGKLINIASTDHTYMTLDSKELTVGGHKNQITISNVNKVFVYDTTKDADGGRWTSDERAQSSSWYNETRSAADACIIGTNTRCGAQAFPKKAILVVTNTQLLVFDAKDNSLWMEFDKGTTTTQQMIGQTTNSTGSSAFGLNGRIYYSARGSVGEAFVIDFKNDYAYKYNTSGSFTDNKNVFNRNSTVTWTTLSATPALVNAVINDITVTVINGKTYFAVATDGGTNGGLSLIDETDQTIANLGVASKAHQSVKITPDNVTYSLNSTDSELDVWYQASTLSGNNVATSTTYSTATIPALWTSAPTINTSAPDQLFVTQSTSTIDGKSNTIYAANNAGLAVIQEKQGSESAGSVKYYDSNKITEEMLGDVRGMWPGIEASGNLADASVKGNTLTASGLTYAASGVRGTTIAMTGASNNATSVAGTLLGTINTIRTVSAWIFPTTLTVTNGVREMAVSADANTASKVSWGIGTKGDGVNANIFCFANGSAFTEINSTVAAVTNTWYHVVLTSDGAGNLSCFVNGVSMATGTVTTPETPTRFQIGATQATTAFNALGARVDETMISATQATASEVSHMYQVGYRALNSGNNGSGTFHSAQTIRNVTVTADGGQKLNGGSNVVKAVNAFMDKGLIYVGTSGGISVMGMDNDTISDLYSTSINTTDDVGTAYGSNTTVSVSVSKGYGTGALMVFGQSGGIWSESNDTSFKDFLASSYNPFGSSLTQSNLNVDSLLRVVGQISSRLDQYPIGSGATGVTQPYLAEAFRVDNNGNLLSRSLSNSTTAMQFQDASGTTVLDIDTTNDRVGIGTVAPKTTLEIGSGNLSAANAGYVTGAPIFVARFDGPKPDETDFTGNQNAHLGQAGTIKDGVIFRPAKFGKGVQIAETTTNLVTNPSFETNTTGWAAITAGGGAIISQVATESAVGTNSLNFKSDTAANSARFSITLSATTTYTATAWVKGSGKVSLRLVDGAIVGSTTAILNNTWTRYSTSITTSGTPTSPYVEVGQNGTGTVNAFIDAVQVEAKTYRTPYADGSMGNGHVWTGAAHASTSTRTIASLSYTNPITNANVNNGGSVSLWWVPGNPNTTQQNATLFSEGNLKATFASATGFLSFTDGTNTISTAAFSFSADTPIYLVFTYGSGGLKIYRNGASAATGGTYTAPAPGAKLYVGSSTTPDQQINGLIDDFAFFPSILSAQEAYAIWKSNAPITTDDQIPAFAKFTSASTIAATNSTFSTTINHTGVVTTGTENTYGLNTSVTRTGATGGIINTYGSYITATGDNAGATTNLYGNYVTATGAKNTYGLYSTVTAAAATTAYAVYADAGAGAGTGYAGIFLNGNVGIGTTAPVTTLDVQASTATFRVKSTGDNASTSVFDSGSTAAQISQLIFRDRGTDKWALRKNSSNDFDFIDIANSNATSLYLKTGGNVGINTILPLATLDVRRNVGTAPAASVSGATSFATLVVDNSLNSDIFAASSSGLPRVKITTGGNIVPGTTGTQSLGAFGAAALEWQFLNLSGGILTSNGQSVVNVQTRHLGNGDWTFDANASVSGNINVAGTACIGFTPAAGCTGNAGALVIVGATGTGKVDVGTVDPPYTINGDKYATYVSGMVGQNEEVAGNLTTGELVDNIGYRQVIDFSNLPKGSNLWLFSKVTDLTKHLSQMSVVLTPGSAARSWYEVDPTKFTLTIYSSRPTTVSYRLTAPRFDSEKWANARSATDTLSGFVINSPDQPLANLVNGNPIALDPVFTKTNINEYQLTVGTNPITEIGSYAKLLVANLSVGFIHTEKLISPLADIDTLTATTISAQTASISAVVANEATISGTLYAANIQSPVIDDLTSKYASASAILAAIKAKYSDFNSLNSPSTKPDPMSIAGLPTSNATISGQLALMNQPLIITDTLLVNTSLISNSINSNNTALYLQPTANQPINLLAGLMILTPDGKVNINGDLNITGNLYANNINGKQTITNQLNTTNATVSGQLVLGKETAQATDSGKLLSLFNNHGDLVGAIDASGAANFNNLATKEVTTNGLIIASAATESATATSSASLSSNATIGTAIIKAGATELTITNSSVKAGTYIYLTPITDTANQVLYVKTKQAGVGFTVSINQGLANDVKFNYWLIQTQP